MENIAVFISSTYEDLKDYRKSIQETLHRLKTAVNSMEYFGSMPGTPKDECLKMVGDSHIYIGVFAMRYGSIDNESGMSLTHLEYLEAQKKGLKSLIYILDEDNQPVLPKYVDTGKHAEKLKKLKTELKKKFTVSFFTTPDDLAKKISQDIPVVLKDIGIDFIEKEINKTDRKEAAERHWQYIQTHSIINIEVYLFLKSSVGNDWLIKHLNDITISLSKKESGLKLKEVLEKSPAPNTKDENKALTHPICNFWEIYEPETGYWCNRINPNRQIPKQVGGFSTTIPLISINKSGVLRLQDLAMKDAVGISVPSELFQAGIEELIFCVNGDTFLFSVYFSDNLLDMYHDMAGFFSSPLGKLNEPIWLSMCFSGVQLLDDFHDQMMPGYNRVGKKSVTMMGHSRSNGNAIFFYPTMPIGFHNTEEFKEYATTISVPETIDIFKVTKDLEAILGDDNSNPDNYYKLASIYTIQGQRQKVIELLTNAITKIDLTVELYGLLAHAHYSLGRYNEAMIYYEKATLLSPENSMPYNGLGFCFRALNDDDRALIHFEKAVLLDSSNSNYQLEYSKQLNSVERSAEALSAAKLSVSLDSKNVDSLVYLGLLLMNNLEFDEAIKLFKESTNIDSKCDRAYLYYAMALALKGDIDNAVPNFQKAIKINRTSDSYSLFIEFMMKLGYHKELISICEDGLLTDPNNTELLTYLGGINANLGNYDEAIKSLEKAITTRNDDKVEDLIRQLRHQMAAPKKTRKRS